MTSAAAYLAWKSENSLRTPRKAGEKPSLAALKEKKLKLEIGVLEERQIEQRRKNAREAVELVERIQVRADMSTAANKAMAILQQKFETELPPKQDGLPAEKIAEMNRDALLEVRTILSQPTAYVA